MPTSCNIAQHGVLTNAICLHPSYPAQAFLGAWARRGGGGWKVPAVQTIHDIEMKLSRVVENHKIINLV